MDFSIEKLAPQDEEAIKQGGSKIVAEAEAYEVDSPLTYKLSVAFRQEIKARRDFAWTKTNKIVSLIFAAHRAACEHRDELCGPYDIADKVIERKQATYLREQKRLEDESRAKAQAEARRIEEENRAREVQELKDSGMPQAAEKLATEPLDIPQVFVPSFTPKVAGAIPTKRWKAEVTSLAELAKFIGENPQYEGFISVNLSKLQSHASNTKGLHAIPGVKFYQELSVTNRKAANTPEGPDAA